jgi:DNA (cytosine-5)-methyltransferase 1
MKIIAVDFFCGVGGATKGFQRAGIEIIKGFDIDATCSKTYEENCRPAYFSQVNLNILNPETVKQELKEIEYDSLVLIACAPCQPFSRSYKKIASTDDRTHLILRFLDFVKVLKPSVIFVENVPAFEQAEGGSFVSRLQKYDLNYQVNFKLINAKNYGVPQNRSRFILLASKKGKIHFPLPTHGKGLLPYITVRETIAEYPAIQPGEIKTEIPNHISRRISELNQERLKKTPKNGGSRIDWPPSLWLNCHKKPKAGHSDVYGRMSWDRPSPTLTCKCNSISNGRFGHPEQDRAISLREAASLQTFPKDFVFFGNQSDIARHIGNAVPPLLAEIMGKAIKDHLLSDSPFKNQPIPSSLKSY